MTAGLLWWALAFTLLYAVHGVGCERGWADVQVLGTSMQRVVLIALWLLLTAGAVALALGVRWQLALLTERVGRWSAWSGAWATFVSGLPVVVVPACL